MKYFFLAMTLLLISCDKQNDLLNLNQLPTLVKQCQLNPPVTAEQNEKCRQIFDTAKKVNDVIEEIQRGPEEFGQRILQLQMQYATLKTADKNKSEADEVRNKIQLDLAVLGLGSPE